MMKILVVAAEVAPFAKVGGLADVAGALPKALRAQGHDVRVVMPCYPMIENNPAYTVREVLPDFPVPVGTANTEKAFVRATQIPGAAGREAAPIPVYLIGHSPKKGRRGYFLQATESRKVYTLTPEPYCFFCRAVLEMLLRLEPDWQPDVIHCNDWHSGLIPVYARTFYQEAPAIARAGILFTIHNLAYQGNFPRSAWPATGLPEDFYAIEGLEFYGEWSFMKGGLVFADRVNTVSETYVREIQTPEYGCGLDGLMRTLAQNGRLSGILNGIDYAEYDPATDPRLPAHFSADDASGKLQCRAALQAELGLPQRRDVPVIGLISRLADQKGLDLIHAIAEEMLALPLQFILLGAGDPAYERFFRDMQKQYPAQVHARIGFDIALAQRIYAGSDLFLMPSRFEPCGLGQMFAFRYGAIPIVRATGGLADTVHPLRPTEEATGEEMGAATDGAAGAGFVFVEYTGRALMSALCQALGAFQKPVLWESLVKCALRSNFSWERSAALYADLYEETAAARRDKEPSLFPDLATRVIGHGPTGERL